MSDIRRVCGWPGCKWRSSKRKEGSRSKRIDNEAAKHYREDHGHPPAQLQGSEWVEYEAVASR